jgi:hypothetical protein
MAWQKGMEATMINIFYNLSDVFVYDFFIADVNPFEFSGL